MAKATKKTETVVTGMTLELSEKEAQALADLLGRHVVGRIYGRRSYTSSIYNALDDAGVKTNDTSDMSGQVWID